MENLEEKIKLKSEFINEQNVLIMNSFEEIEKVIAENYFKDTYKINIQKNKQIKKDSNKELLIDGCQQNEKDFFVLEKEINNLIKKYIEEYNSNIKEFRVKFIELYNSSTDGLLNIVKIIKGEGDDKLLNIQEEEIKNFDINKPEFQEILSNYLNYQIKEEELSDIIKTKKYKFQIKEKIDIPLNKLYNIKQTKHKNNLVVTSRDVYNIIEQIQSHKFQLIDTTNYNLELERNKILISEKLGKLLGYDFFKKTKIEYETFSKEEENKNQRKFMIIIIVNL